MKLILGLLFLSCHYFCNAQILIIASDSIIISEGKARLYYNFISEKFDSVWHRTGLKDGKILGEIIEIETRFYPNDDSTIRVEWIIPNTGRVFQQGTFLNGLANGVFIRDFGMQVDSVHFERGKKNGAQIESSDNYRFVTYYKDGLKNGIRYRQVTSTGLIDIIEHYIDGLKHGTAQYYSATALGEVSLLYSHEYKNGSPLDGIYTYYNQGLVWIKGQYKNGVKYGWETTYDGYGQVVKRMFYKGGKVTRYKKFEREYDIDP